MIFFLFFDYSDGCMGKATAYQDNTYFTFSLLPVCPSVSSPGQNLNVTAFVVERTLPTVSGLRLGSNSKNKQNNLFFMETVIKFIIHHFLLVIWITLTNIID